MSVATEIEPQSDVLRDEPPFDDPPDDDGDHGDDGNFEGPWETVATFWQPAEAHVVRIRLESQGIKCLILDENLVATDWLYANAVGGHQGAGTAMPGGGGTRTA